MATLSCLNGNELTGGPSTEAIDADSFTTKPDITMSKDKSDTPLWLEAPSEAQIPKTTATMEVACPHCAKRLHFSQSNSGQAGTCPACKKRFRLPNLAGRPARSQTPPPTAPAETTAASKLPVPSLSSQPILPPEPNLETIAPGLQSAQASKAIGSAPTNAEQRQSAISSKTRKPAGMQFGPRAKICAAVFCALLAFAVYCIVRPAGTTQSPNGTSGSATSTAQSPGTSQGEALKVDQIQLCAEYDFNQVAADEMYKGRLVEIDVGWFEMDSDILGNVRVSSPVRRGKTGLQFVFDNKHRAEAARLQNRYRQKVRAICRGKSLDVVILDAVEVIVAGDGK
jgi:hypothetical protein